MKATVRIHGDDDRLLWYDAYLDSYLETRDRAFEVRSELQDVTGVSWHENEFKERLLCP